MLKATANVTATVQRAAVDTRAVPIGDRFTLLWALWERLGRSHHTYRPTVSTHLREGPPSAQPSVTAIITASGRLD